MTDPEDVRRLLEAMKGGNPLDLSIFTDPQQLVIDILEQWMGAYEPVVEVVSVQGAISLLKKAKKWKDVELVIKNLEALCQ